MKYLAPLAVILVVTAWFYSAAKDFLIIAHRGASGYLPEHTSAAFELAHAQGADYLEADLVMTKDGVMIVRHDMTLDSTTNVADVFPDRQRADGRWHAVDFTLAEIKQIQAIQHFPGRSRQPEDVHRVMTLDEYIQLVRRLNAAAGREAGLYIELKHPEKHRAMELPMESRLLETLTRYGYIEKSDKAIIQSFSADSLQRLRDQGSKLRLVQLIGGKGHDRMVTPEGLSAVASYAYGIGPHKQRVVDDQAIVDRAHEHGLVVHPYTFRADVVPSDYDDFGDEVRQFVLDYGVDGLITDHPDLVAAAL